MTEICKKCGKGRLEPVLAEKGKRRLKCLNCDEAFEREPDETQPKKV